MDQEVQHEREMILNAHFAWALYFWGSAEVAREQRNTLLAPIGYYYAAFHGAFAAMMTDHTYNLAHTKEIKHGKLQRWLLRKRPALHSLFGLLKDIRVFSRICG